jgi:hypothetical protein
VAKIFWVASFPKSGNTWMRAFLANMLLAKDRPLSLNEIGKACASEANVTWYRPLLREDESDIYALSNRRVMELRPSAQKRITEVNNNDVFIKTHNINGKYCGFPLIRKDVTLGSVYIVRDPRDVVISAADHWGMTIDEMLDAMVHPAFRTENGDGLVFELISTWSDHVASWAGIKAKNHMTVRYEDLLADPVRHFGKLAKGIGLSQDLAPIRQVVEWTSFNKLRQMEEQEGFAERSNYSERFFRSGKSGNWRKTLTSAQVARIEREHGKVMRKLGYL